jgi:hypothetical protein
MMNFCCSPASGRTAFSSELTSSLAIVSMTPPIVVSPGREKLLSSISSNPVREISCGTLIFDC